MNTGFGPKPVHVTIKATRYATNDRADLRTNEIVRLVQEKRGVHLGSSQNADFLLAWDHRKNLPIVLLISHEAAQDVVISIWEPHYYGIPKGLPTASQMWHAFEQALPS